LKLVLKKQIGKKGRALKVERKVKDLPRHKKEALIKTGTGLEALLGGSKS
jgi:predicted GIY-YIG superfamily endonuclease